MRACGWSTTLQSYEGALVVISHDRHLLRNTVDQFFLIHNTGQCDLKDYQNWLKNFSRDVAAPEEIVAESAVDKKLARQQSAESRKKIAPLKKEIKTIESKIEKQQSQLADLEAKLADASIYDEENKQKLKTALADQAEIKKLLSGLEENWLEKQELINLLAIEKP